MNGFNANKWGVHMGTDTIAATQCEQAFTLKYQFVYWLTCGRNVTTEIITSFCVHLARYHKPMDFIVSQAAVVLVNKRN